MKLVFSFLSSHRCRSPQESRRAPPPPMQPLLRLLCFIMLPAASTKGHLPLHSQPLGKTQGGNSEQVLTPNVTLGWVSLGQRFAPDPTAGVMACEVTPAGRTFFTFGGEFFFSFIRESLESLRSSFQNTSAQENRNE